MRSQKMRDMAISMRGKGMSLTEISKSLSIAKSTASLWLRDVKLDEAAKARLDKRKDDNRVAFGEWSKRTREDPARIKAAREYGRMAWEMNPEQCLSNFRGGSHIGSMSYRKDELPIKKKLEKLFQCEFQKEKLAGFYFDFANEYLLIEHSTDGTHGLHDVMRRFSAAKGIDDRIKIAIIDTTQLGPKRGPRLRGCVNYIVDYRALA